MAELLQKAERELLDGLRGFLPQERIFTDPLRRLAYGTDASFYRMVPKIVVKADTPEEIARILRLCAGCGVPLTFRAAGTSLSGQAVSDSVLVLTGQAWKKIEVAAAGERITLGPGVTGGEANRALAGYGRKIGPDPASIESAMIGGIAANNASGMCCGTSRNAYQTVRGLKIILVDGSCLDTADPGSRREFAHSHPGLFEGLRGLSRRVRADAALCEKIRRKYRIKNTTGYSLNAFLDFEHPLDILEHLMIGSEGTLGFMAEITLETVPEEPCRACALIYFENLDEACSVARLLAGGAADAAELMDRASLEAVSHKVLLPELRGEACALLVEIRGKDRAELEGRMAAATRRLQAHFPALEPRFSADPVQIKAMWDVRKGLFPTVGALRRAGTSVIIEDVCFPLERLAAGARDLRRLLDGHGYADAIIFGHALDGNLHFVFKQDWSQPGEAGRYGAFMEGLVRLITQGYDGSLKAEHGTGRNMAPFVEREWGRDAYRLMQDLKQLFDPAGILNPGVILNPDPQAHLKNLKPMPPADALIDSCTECGFCEPVCPSKNLTLTPRQRIVAYREIVRLRQNRATRGAAAELERLFDYAGEKTCAADGLCALRCPVSIDTGRLVKKLRCEKLGPVQRALGWWAARHYGALLAAVRSGLRAARMLSRTLPAPAARFSAKLKPAAGVPRVVVFPSCVLRTLATPGQPRPLWEAAQSLLEKAGCGAVFPDALEGLCCGLAFESKGHAGAADMKFLELEKRLWQASGRGHDAVLIDTSPCHARFAERSQLDWKGGLYEPAGFIRRFLAPRLSFSRTSKAVALHVPCASRKIGLEADYQAAAALCAQSVCEIPAGCCGFAGDKGWSLPELTASALAGLKTQLQGRAAHGISASLTCETGLSRHAGIPFQSLLYLADECSQRMLQ